MAAPTTPRTIVITGASSGIGLAAARAFAARGDRLVLVARGAEALEQAGAACAELGAEVLVVPLDVADAAAVEELARAAERRFGRIDVWVNNAAVAMFGRFEELPPADVARVVEVNVNGYAWGAQAALRRFRRQGFGTLVNVGSANGRIASPLSTTYVMTKFAVAGLSESLRAELVDEPDVHVCTVLPASIDTPLYSNAANYTGEVMGPAGPAFDPDDVADAVLRCADEHPREVKVGWTGTAGQLLNQVAGGLWESTAGRIFPSAYSRGEAAPPTSGNLHEPCAGPPRTRGGWTHAGGMPHGFVAAAAGVAGLAAAAIGVVARRRSSGG